MNSIIRALTLLSILYENTDKEHPLTQAELLEKMQEEGLGSATEKTVRSDLNNIIEYGYSMDYNRAGGYDDTNNGLVAYDGEEHKTNFRFVHLFSNYELNLLIELIKADTSIEKKDSERLIEKLKALGSSHYTYSADSICNLPTTFSTIDETRVQENLSIINEAINGDIKRKISFHLNTYDKDGKLVPVRNGHLYKENPYYVIKYRDRTYLLSTSGEYTDVHIMRLDLMSDLVVLNEKSLPKHKVDDIRDGGHTEFIRTHLNMHYDAPVEATIEIKNDAYVFLRDSFGENYEWKGSKDEETDVVKVKASKSALTDWAIRFYTDVKVTEPEDLIKDIRKKIKDLNLVYYLE